MIFFRSMIEAAQAIALDALSRAQKVLGGEGVRVIVEENSGGTIPETGVGGFTPDSHTVYVYIDSTHPSLQENLGREVLSTVTHEYHHAIRNRAIDWESDTLFGAMITEGLADHFDLELNGGGPRPWSIALSEQQLSGLKDSAAREFDSRTYDHAAWFFGSEDRGIPSWGGYALGFKLVSEYLALTGTKASELVSVPPERFKSVVFGR